MEKVKFSILGLACLLLLGSCQVFHQEDELTDFQINQENLVFWKTGKVLTPITVASVQSGQASFSQPEKILKSFFASLSNFPIQNVALIENQGIWYLNGFDGIDNMYFQLVFGDNSPDLLLTALYIKCTGCKSCILNGVTCFCIASGSCSTANGVIPENFID